MVTVIIPTYNNENTIERAILSVVSQSCVDWQIVVVDDCCTDNTPKLLEKYRNYGSRFKVVRNDVNVGVGISRQKGLKEADGEFVTFLDSDDFLKPDFIEVSMMLQEQHDSDIVYTSYSILFPEGVMQVIPAGDYIMTEEGTAQLHFVQEKKFLTGKVFRKTLLEKTPWSDKRVGEDVQTLFFATYLADKVRSSSYSGYVHVYRPGSLLADAPYLFCYCGSSSAEHEMIDFLIEKEDERLWKYALASNVMTHNSIVSLIKEGEKISKKELRKNKEAWKELCVWYKKHEKYIKLLGLEVSKL